MFCKFLTGSTTIAGVRKIRSFLIASTTQKRLLTSAVGSLSMLRSKSTIGSDGATHPTKNCRKRSKRGSVTQFILTADSYDRPAQINFAEGANVSWYQFDLTHKSRSLLGCGTSAETSVRVTGASERHEP